MSFLIPDWPAPKGVYSLVTLRAGGDSVAPYDSLNLALHVGDEVAHVSANRRLIEAKIASMTGPSSIQWLNQTHSTTVIEAHAEPVSDATRCIDDPMADACFTRQPRTACAVMTADCLPLLFCRLDGSAVAATHAGWKGLADGIIEQTVISLGGAADELMVWLGPAIGPLKFEIGTDVRSLFLQQGHIDDHEATKAAFAPQANDKYLADIYQLARIRLHRLGITAIYGGNLCTVSDEQRFFSYRRDGVTGRLASLIWIDHR